MLDLHGLTVEKVRHKSGGCLDDDLTSCFFTSMAQLHILCLTHRCFPFSVLRRRLSSMISSTRLCREILIGHYFSSDILITPVDQFTNEVGYDPVWEKKRDSRMVWVGETSRRFLS